MANLPDITPEMKEAFVSKMISDGGGIFGQKYPCQFHDNKNEDSKPSSDVKEAVVDDLLSVRYTCSAPTIQNTSFWSPVNGSSHHIAASNIRPSTITIYDSNNEMLVDIDRDGDISYGENYTPDQAAHTFWLTIAHENPTTLRNEINTLKSYIGELELRLSKSTDDYIVKDFSLVEVSVVYDQGPSVKETTDDAYERAMAVIK